MLQTGLYEQVINKKINDELAAAADKLPHTALIDEAEASGILAKYAAEIIEKGLDDLKEKGGSLSEQVALTNKIVSLLQSETKEDVFESLNVDQRAEQLFALLDKKNNSYHLGGKGEAVRPETSIARSSLFTGAIHEPSMYSELKKEILSCNRIDMLVSFIKWSGLRLIIDELRQFSQNGGQLRMITTSYM
ncbi:MAG: NgoFVII family restriction endonuclease, partial [Eubacteriales bacterium]|nr:NgoFVII family restriction endonuclease [Eubacteriales bacterium]